MFSNVKFSHFLLLLVLFLPACTSGKLVLEPIARDNQAVEFDRGISIVTTNKVNTVTVAQGNRWFYSGSEPTFLLVVKNNSSKPFNFSHRNIKVVAAGQSLKVYSLQDMISIIENRVSEAQFMAALFGGVSQSLAYQNAGTTTTYGNVGGTEFKSTTFNEAKAQEAADKKEKKTDSTIDKLDLLEADFKVFLESSMLLKTTVRPGEEISGIVFFQQLADNVNTQRLEVIVDAGGEPHEFTFIHRNFSAE